MLSVLLFFYFYVKSASECDFIKHLYENGNARKKKERLSRIVWDCRETPSQFGQEWVSCFIDRAECLNGYWNKKMRYWQTGILRDFPLSGRLRCVACDRGGLLLLFYLAQQLNIHTTNLQSNELKVRLVRSFEGMIIITTPLKVRLLFDNMV